MDNFKEDEQDDSIEPIVDRGIPSVAREPKGQMVFMAIFLCVAVIAIILVVMAGMKKEESKSKVEPQETVFKSPASNGEPYIKPEQSTPPPQESLAPVEKPAPVDTMAAQKEMMMQVMTIETILIVQEQPHQQEHLSEEALGVATVVKAVPMPILPLQELRQIRTSIQLMPSSYNTLKC